MGLGRSSRQEAGFTLLELLIVIAIIAILAGILITALHGARKRSFDLAALGYLREAMHAQALYSLDTEEYADNLGDLLNKGLRPVPRGIEIRVLSGGTTYCMVASHHGGTRWYAATPEKGPYRTSVPAWDPAPSACP